ncbi:unnamed protein product [Closterium sp. NIES-53]
MQPRKHVASLPSHALLTCDSNPKPLLVLVHLPHFPLIPSPPLTTSGHSARACSQGGVPHRCAHNHFLPAILHAHAAKEACRIAALTANQGVLCFMCLLFPSPLPPSLHHPLFPLPPLALFPLLSLSPSPTPPTILHAHAAKEACRIAALTAICDQAVPCLYPPLLPRPFPVTEHQAILQAQSAKEVCRIAALISILNAKTCAIARAKPRAVGSNQSAIVEVGEGG